VSLILQRPGARGPIVHLQDAWRDSWEALRKSRSDEIARRKESGAPLDDGDGPLEEISAFVADPLLDEVRVRFRTVSPEVFAETTGGVQEWYERTKHLEASEVRARRVAAVDLTRRQAELVRHAVCLIDGLCLEEDGQLIDYAASADTHETLSDEAIELLQGAGLIPILYATARDFQVLDPLGRGRYGCAAPLTLAPLTAAPASNGNAKSAAATAMPVHCFSMANDTDPTHARAVFGSAIPTSDTHRGSTG